MTDDGMTDDAVRVLKALHGEGATGKIEAQRVFPHPHHFKLPRTEHAAIEVTLNTITALVTAKLIAPALRGPQSDPAAYDRFNYVITEAGRRVVERVELDRKADQARRAERR